MCFNAHASLSLHPDLSSFITFTVFYGCAKRHKSFDRQTDETDRWLPAPNEETCENKYVIVKRRHSFSEIPVFVIGWFVALSDTSLLKLYFFFN